MDPTTGRPAPCPNCGSRNVRWRNRRVYDFIFTWARAFADTALSAVLVRGATGAARSHLGTGLGSGAGQVPAVPASRYVPEWQLRNQGRAMLYNKRREVYEAQMGLAVGKHFWRCRDCRQKGQVFSGLDELLTTERAALASLEDQIIGDVGAVGRRVDRHGLSDQ